MGISFQTVLSLAVTFCVGACMTNAPEPVSSTADRPRVSRLDLSNTTGQVGEKFKAEVQMETQLLGSVEVQVRSLPPGLQFDAKTRTISGVPEADGFYAVTVAVRKKRGPGVHFSTPEGAWFSERLSIDIYNPIDENNGRDAWDDKGIASLD